MTRKFLVLCFLLMSFNVLMAQKMQVESLCLVPNDLSASINPCLDLNGDPCALVKIVINDKLVAVEGNVIGQIVSKGTEKWVYVSEGTKELRVIPGSFGAQTIRFADYGISALRGKSVYLLELVGENKLETTSMPSQSDTSKKTPGLTKAKIIKGVVYNDRKHAKPIVGAIIRASPIKVAFIHDDRTAGTVSGIDGEFSIWAPAGAKTLFISHVDYKKKSIELYDDMKDNIVVYIK